MGTSWNRLWFGGSHNRYEEFTRLLNDLASDLKPLIIQPEPGKPKRQASSCMSMVFPRRGSGARPVRWLSELLPRRRRRVKNRRSACRQAGCSCPSAWSFGLLDTVASVGVAHVVPVADGHMSGQTARWSCRMMKPMAG